MSFGQTRRRLLSTAIIDPPDTSLQRLARLDDDLHHLQFQSPFQVRQTYAALLKHCGNAAALPQGRRIHAHIVASGLASDGFLGDHLLQMYGKCGSVDDAIQVFHALPRRSLFSWNFIIAAFAKNRHGRKAIEMFRSMDSAGIKPDSATLSSVLGACSSLRDLEEGRRIHGRISSGEFQSGIVVETGLVKMYARCGRLREAREVFDRIENKDVICWNSMIAAYAQGGHSAQARQLCEEMEGFGVKASDTTFAGILGACSSLEEGKKIHSRALARGLSSSIIVQNALVSMYARCSRLDVARVVFDKIESKSVVSWNAMIAACARQGEAEQALQLFERMELEPNEVTFASVFNACSLLPDHREVGKRIHDRIRGSHLEANVTVATAIVTMYGKFGKVGMARQVFNGIQHKNVVSWNAMLGAYTQNNLDREALEVYHEMVAQKVQQDEVTVVIALGISASLRLLKLGIELHELSVAHGYDSNIKVQNALISMYGKCNELDAARRVFSKVRAHDVVSWTALIVAYTQHGRNREALELYKQMEGEGMEPDKVTFTSVLSACSNTNDLELGQALHARLLARKDGFSDGVLVAALINMYVKCGRLDLSSEIFQSCKDTKAVVVWNAMITAYEQEGYSRAAVDLYDMMKQRGLDPDESTLSSILSACAELKDLEKGEQVHVEIIASRDCSQNPVVLNALISMYASCGEIREAKAVFKRMKNRDVVSWTILISAYVQGGDARRALRLYRRMLVEGVQPTEVTMLAVIAACSAMESLWEGIVIHALTDSMFFTDTAVQAALISMYARCRRLDLACQVFRQVRHLESSANCWNAMLAAYSQLGLPEEGIRLYWEMSSTGIKANEGTFAGALAACSMLGAVREGYRIHEQVSSSRYSSDLSLKTALVHMYAKCNRVDAAFHVFEQLQPDVVAWNAMIAAYAQNGYAWHALELYSKMVSESNVTPDAYTITNILSVCSNARLLDNGRTIFEQAVRQSPELERNTAVECAVFNLYAKCGKLDVATAMFERMEAKNAVCWHGIIAAYAHHGYGIETLWFYRLFELHGYKPLEPTFLCVFLACGHAGLVDECKWYFQSMIEDRITPTFDHYSCVVTVLSRAGKLEEAEDLLHSMPFNPGSVGWTSLLGACRTHGDLKRARRAADEAMELDRQDSAPYVLLSNVNIFAASGCLDHLRKKTKHNHPK
ncbi:pentatricopeptide repeat-containing protein At2g39620 [Selaginella moellendorffii]|uniref:pentatricopeptide repeat-containing protein At2g39620 n=1 Tax=Selaginella moellendorffii TaxID=88036 RepID=UPI000D1C3755|nr:pentatricopeptide repeat-containing protein At2g39620 [Selaginella moellendorffii]|eukprot:XP_024537981.1 pentatricopeptide repeat-containing protein At2g39620 [Selaginella moellendorffii]